MSAQKSIEALNERSASGFLSLLICGDLAFIAMHCINSLTPDSYNLHNTLLSIDEDGGYPEIYQYLKFFWIVVLLAYISIEQKTRSYFAWVLVFTYLLLDDSLSIHESVGRVIAAHWHFIPPFGLRLQDFGELTVSATLGSILLVPLAWAYKSGDKTFRRTSHDIALLLFALVFFGVVVDMLHTVVQSNREARFIVGIIEDGGEMLSASLILWYMFLTKVHSEDASGHISDLVLLAITRNRR